MKHALMSIPFSGGFFPSGFRKISDEFDDQFEKQFEKVTHGGYLLWIHCIAGCGICQTELRAEECTSVLFSIPGKGLRRMGRMSYN